MGAPFADVHDLGARWRPLSEDESTVAQTLLQDASTRIRAEARRCGVDLDQDIIDGTLDPDVPMLVVCRMVREAMLAPADQPPVQSFQVSAGPFNRSGRFLNPTGDLYLTKADRKLLGIGRQQAFTVPATSWGDEL